MATQFHVNPRFRAYGKARLDIAARAQSREQWEDLWKPPINEFPFEWGHYWKHCVEYRVDDYAAEVGFFIDILGFAVNAFDPNYAQFTSPDGEFFFAVVPASPEQPATPPDALRLQFMIRDLEQTARELIQRGVVFEQTPAPLQPGSNLMLAVFRSPHGMVIELWGEQKQLVVVPTVERAGSGTEIATSTAVEPTDVTERVLSAPAKPIVKNSDVEPYRRLDEVKNNPVKVHLPVLEQLKKAQFGLSERKSAGNEINEGEEEAPVGGAEEPITPMREQTPSDNRSNLPLLSGLPVEPKGPMRKSSHFVRRGSLKNKKIRLAVARSLLRDEIPS